MEEPDGFYEPIKVLITLHEGMDTMDAIGPMEVFSLALHDKKVKGRRLRCLHQLESQLLTLIGLFRVQGVPCHFCWQGAEHYDGSEHSDPRPHRL